MSRRNKKIPIDKQVQKLQAELKEHHKLTGMAQRMLMEQVLRFLEDGKHEQLKQFCRTYAVER